MWFHFCVCDYILRILHKNKQPMSNFQSVSKFYSYDAFMRLMEELVAQEKTTGNQPPVFVYYTKLNLQRMQRWNKTFQLNAQVARVVQAVQPQIWWVINEAWCGDAAQILPGMAKMAEAANGHIDLRIIMRDDNATIMDKYLTNGSRSIPKLVATDDAGNDLFDWGPRPAFAQKMMMDRKANKNGETLEVKEKELHLWYAKDKGQSTQQELLQILQRQLE
jgi:hypothetical protein